MNYCETCNAPRVDKVAIILRCWRCYVQPGKPPSKYISIKEQQP